MAERITAKAKRQAAPKGARKSAPKVASKKTVQGSTSGSASIAADDGELVDENQRLKSELATARERIADLELKHVDITNRIAWVIDSLHNLDE